MALLLLGPLLRYVDETRGDRLGRDRRALRGRGPRAIAARRSTSPATTTRSSTSTASSPGPPRRTRSTSTASATGRSPTATFPPSVDPDAERRRPPPHRLRLLPRQRARTRSRTRCARTRTARPRDRRALRPGAAHGRASRRATWPTRLLLLGDQVYADEVSPGTRDVHRARAATPSEPPGEEVADFEEYTHLYLDSWSEPIMRWLLSTRPQRDDLRRPRRPRRLEHLRVVGARRCAPSDWWEDRIIGGVHVLLALPAPRQPLARRAGRGRAATPQVRAADDGAAIAARLRPPRRPRDRRHALELLAATSAACALVVIDSRAGRVLEDGRRCMVDDDEWDVDLRARSRAATTTSSSPPRCRLLLGHGLHYLEAWNEAVCDGRLGAARRRASASGCAGPSTSSTGRRSASPSSG